MSLKSSHCMIHVLVRVLGFGPSMVLGWECYQMYS